MGDKNTINIHLGVNDSGSKYWRNLCDLFAKVEDVLVNNLKKKQTLEEFHDLEIGMLLENSLSWQSQYKNPS